MNINKNIQQWVSNINLIGIYIFYKNIIIDIMGTRTFLE